MRYRLLTVLILSCLRLQGQNIDELTIINLSIDSTYDLETCFRIIRPPFFRCCKKDTLPNEKFMECCNAIDVPKEFRVNCIRCINENELDSTELIMLIHDSAFKFDITRDKKFLLNLLDRKSKFYSFVKDFKNILPEEKYNVDSLRQGRIRFITKKTFDAESRSHKFGKYGKQMLLGYYSFSRVYFNQQKTLAMYKMSWLGGNFCGYKNIIFLSCQDGIWKFERNIMLGVY